MSYTKRLYGCKASIFLGLINHLVVICSCSGGLVYIDDKTFTNNYLEGDVVYTDKHTATKFIQCVSICIKKCMPPCPLISFTDGICRCHSSYAHNSKGQYAPNRDKTMYFRIANKNDGEKETAIVSTTANPSISESSSLIQEESECIYFTNTLSTADFCQTVLGGDYYIQVFNTPLNVTFNSFSHVIYLSKSYRAKFNFEHQVDGSYLIYAKNNMNTNYFLHVNGSSLYVQLSDASTPVNQTYYFLEYQPEGTFRIKVKSLGYYIAKSGLFLSLTTDTYGDNGKFLIETASPEWDIIFRIPSGSIYNMYQAFLYGTKQLMTNSCEVNIDGTCKYSFERMDHILRDWWKGCLSVCKVKLSLIQNNIVLLDFIFDGVNTSPETWFMATKLQRSNYISNITGLSLTAAMSGDWYFMVTDTRIQFDTRIQYNIFAACYDPSSPNRTLSLIALGARRLEAEVQISVTTK